MKGIQIKEYVKGPDDLIVTSQPDPIPKENQYLVGIRAAATNFFDLLQIRGKYQLQPPLPWISGMEFSGIILQIPKSGTSKFKVGDKVFGAGQGSYATKICVSEEVLHSVPEGWSFEEAAGLYVTAPTSYAALVIRAQVKPGEWVLVHAGAGGVGLAAIQIAKALGAKVVATAGTDEKLKICKSFGADHGINYSNKTWPQEVLKLTDGKGVDVVFDPVGLVDISTKCIAWNGRILIIGFAGGNIEKMPMNKVLLKNISLQGLHWGAYARFESDKIAPVWDSLFKLMTEGKFKPTVYDKKYNGLDEVGRALKSLGARETWGKVVVSVPEEEDKARL